MASRYLVDPLPAQGRARLPEGLARHLGSVLRVRPGDVLRLFDGRGGEAEAEVAAVGRDAVEVLAGPARRVPPPARRVHVAFAVPRWQRAEWLFEHGTEVGVDTFHPLRSERSRPQGERPDRWRRICEAAAGQCDRAYVPSIRPVRDLAGFVADPSLPRERWLAVPGAPPLPSGRSPEAVLLVGPEGGLTEAEAALAGAAGFQPCGLGEHVLRTETAALVGAVLLLHGMGK